MTDKRIEQLVAHAIETTPPPIDDNIIALLPGVFAELLDAMKRWRAGEGQDDDLPFPLRMYQCTDCIIGVAGDRVREITGDQQYGFSPR